MNPVLSFGRHTLNQIETGITKEWVETNGLGSYAMGTAVGANTRRYHALFTLTTEPSLQRLVMVNRMEESVLVNGRRMDCSCQEYPGTISPRGYLHLESFTYDPFPRWVYAIENLKLEKRMFLKSGEETAVVVYRNLVGPTVKIILRPFFSCRDHHMLAREDHRFEGAIHVDANHIRCALPGLPEFFTSAFGDDLPQDALRVYPEEYWYRNLVYAQEEERELEYQEDLFSPCQIHAELAPGQQMAVIFSNRRHNEVRVDKWIDHELFMRRETLEPCPLKSPFAQRLVLAADQFLVRTPQGPRILSGYPWHTDTLRETLMSLPGICLATGRRDDAVALLRESAKLLNQGLLPHRFPDGNNASLDYSNMDVSLWFVWAVQKTWESIKDEGFLREMKPHMEHILHSIRNGIRMQDPRTQAQTEIRMDSDGLVSGSSNKAALTWMNGRMHDWTATPRKGKPVEVQALWYNALQFCSEAALKFDGNDGGWGELAKKARDSFNMTFWNPQNNYLYDVVDGNAREGSIRPNALYAMSLPYEILETEKFKPLFETAWKTLYTSLGLRTLSTSEPHFHGIYRGDERDRVSAAHNGTVHPFLIGPFLTAYFKTYGREQKQKEDAHHFLTPFVMHLADSGLGTISEFFDGNSPHSPRGCVADARAVAELLRVLREEGLEL